MNKAVFLDRDGTLNIDTGYISDPKELVFIRGAKKAVKLLKDKSFLIYVITNQSGVGRGFFSVEKLEAVHDKMLSEFDKEGIKIDGIFYCPHHPNEKCQCRKPKPKMVFDIVNSNKINLTKSYFIGDKLIDVQTGKNAGCRTILVETGEPRIEDEEDWTQPDFVAEDLLEAARWILKQTKNEKRKAQN